MASRKDNTVFTNSLAQRAASARSSKQERQSRDSAERTARQTTHLALLKAQLLANIRANLADVKGTINKGAAAGHDSARVARYYLPSNIVTTETDENGVEYTVVEQQVPQELTYISAPGENSDSNSSPIAMLLQGKHDRKTRKNDPSALPGGRTVIQLVNDELDKEPEGSDLYGCTLACEMAQDREFKVTDRKTGRERNATCFNVMLIWDLKSYNTRLRERNEKRKAAAEERRKPTRTMAEYQAEKAAKSQAAAATANGFHQVKPRRRPRKPAAAEDED